MQSRPPIIHPAWMRLTHWLNAIAVLLMLLSGWRIYNAAPLFPFTFPPGVTLGGWLGGGLQWHFAAMWLLVLNGLVYLVLGVATGHLRRRLLPLSPAAVWADTRAALSGTLRHDARGACNAVQKLCYLAIIADLLVLVVSGLAIWKSVQFHLLRLLMGGYDSARYVHFGAMAFAAAFIVVHVFMVALVPRTLLSMVRGR